MGRFILDIFSQKTIVFVLGTICFVLVLLLTLNFVVAITVFLFFTFLAIFQNSFSRGWLFLFFVFLIIPRFVLGDSGLFSEEIILIALTLVSLAMIVEKKANPKKNFISGRLFLFWILALVGIISWFLEKRQGRAEQEELLLILYLVILSGLIVVFQYFFQTAKRIKKFFLVLIIAGSLHSLFSLLALVFPFNFLSQGTSSIKGVNLFFGEIGFKTSGFWGDSYYTLLGGYALTGFLLISLAVTFGMIIILQKKKGQPKLYSPMIVKTKSSQEKKYFLDSIHPISASKKVKDKIVNLGYGEWGRKSREYILDNRIFLIFLFIIQFVVFLLTFSYLAFLIFSLGIFFMGVLLRSKGLLSFSASMIIILSVIFPGSGFLGNNSSTEVINQWFSGLDQVKNHWVLGEAGGSIFSENNQQKPNDFFINNSYLFIWNNFGLLGLLIFLFMLINYFLNIREVYLYSDGWQRIWLIVLLTVFLQMVLLGMVSNILIFGPAAICFWLFSGLIENLKEKKIIFGEGKKWIKIKKQPKKIRKIKKTKKLFKKTKKKK